MPLRLFLLAVCVLGLSACSNARETFGLNSAPPDEFAVVDHPPLSMPPDYALHPPKPGEAPFQSVQPSQQAAQTLYGSGAASGSAKASTAEQALLSKTGSQEVDPNIRNTIDHEASQQVVTSRRLIDALLFRDSKKPASPVVDPVAERKRLEEAKKKNESVSTGATPVIGPKKDSTIQ